jgi:LPXTG-site transpeptidase (sortase) family protein
MIDQYRYQKKYPIQRTDWGAWARSFRFPKKGAASFSLIFSGFLILGYLSFYYSDYLLATGNEPASSPLVKAKNTWVSWAENGSQVLGLKKENQLVYRYFQISVPSLKIQNAQVTTNVLSSKKEAYMPVLEESIAHYKGTSLPGQEGNSFLYGHSVLPQFFNRDDYMTIFSTLHKIKDGDEVLVDYGDKQYKYLVYSKEIVDPETLDVIDRSGQGDKTLTLMTCSPPGTYLKRLLVTAKIVE